MCGTLYEQKNGALPDVYNSPRGLNRPLSAVRVLPSCAMLLCRGIDVEFKVLQGSELTLIGVLEAPNIYHVNYKRKGLITHQSRVVHNKHIGNNNLKFSRL